MLKNIWTPIHHINLYSSINNINGIFIEWHQSIHIAMGTFHKCVIFRLDEIQYLQFNPTCFQISPTLIYVWTTFLFQIQIDIMNFVSSGVLYGTVLFYVHWLNIFWKIINYFLEKLIAIHKLIRYDTWGI